MKGDIALAGFVLTVEEWQSLDTLARAQLLAAAFHRDAPWVVAPISGMLAPEPQADVVND